MHVSAILPAAGLGTRMGLPHPERAREHRKQFLQLDGLPVLFHTIRKFDACPAIADITVALRGDDLAWARDLLAAEATSKPVRVIEGGETRQESVENGLRSLPSAADLVAVHDGVRPLIDIELIEKVVEAASRTGAAILGIAPVDTVKQVRLHSIKATIPRETLILAQTPQVFRVDLLRRAFEKARADAFVGTDEASLVERLDEVEVLVVPGSDRNIKITRPNDLALARLFLNLDVG
jgi:2-C-methyl-D-erythritol 4-phosphate cytidylyltransferase